jgi:hypothetical protein
MERESMGEKLSIGQMVKWVKEAASKFPDRRTGKNKQYEMEDAVLGAFAVFFTQRPSFLAYQQEMKRTKGRSNAESLFAMSEVPGDSQIRLLLDPVAPALVNPVFRQAYRGLSRAGVLTRMRSHANCLLIAMDGTEYFSSKKIHCEKCSQRELRDGKVQYYHTVLTPVLVQPGKEQVLALEPEYITPQDGKEKQDCEIEAGKRWIAEYGRFYAKQGATILGDDLFSRQPFIQTLRAKHLHFILVCKPDSHPALYEMVAFLEANGVLSHYQKRHWNGRFGELYTYRYASQLPLRGDQETLVVNWCELTITHENTGEQLYQNAFCTDFEVWESTVEAIVRDGRARWKVENENNNVLKTKGYHLEHNFGHGSQYLASLLLSLNLLAFLFHTLLDLLDEQYRLIRQELHTRRRFFQDLETLLRYFLFASWEEVLQFMFTGLELDTS